MSNDIKTQVVVLGAGPGGYSAAFRAADLGIDTTTKIIDNLTKTSSRKALKDGEIAVGAKFRDSYSKLLEVYDELLSSVAVTMIVATP